MRGSFWAEISIAVLLLAVSFAFVTGHTGQVYAWSSMHHHHHIYFSYYWYYPYYYYPYYSYNVGMSNYGSYSSSYGSNCGSNYGSNYVANYGTYPYYYGSYGMGNYGMGNYGSNYGSYYGGMGNYGSYGQPVQYQLTVNANPSSLSSQMSGGGTYSCGSSASFSASKNLIQVSPDTQYVFSHWSGDYSGSGTSGTITMNGAKAVTAVYQAQYLLTLSAQPSGAPSPQGSGWFNAGDTASVSVPSQIVNQNPGSQLVFTGWSVDGNSNQAGSSLSLQMNAPHTVIAQYKQQYYLTVQSDQGVPSGQGWYDAGSNAPLSVSTPPSPMFGVNYVFNGWQGSTQSQSQSTTVLMNGPMAVTATWHADYTVLYVTIGAIIATLAVAAWALIHVTKTRKELPPTPQEQIR